MFCGTRFDSSARDARDQVADDFPLTRTDLTLKFRHLGVELSFQLRLGFRFTPSLLCICERNVMKSPSVSRRRARDPHPSRARRARSPPHLPLQASSNTSLHASRGTSQSPPSLPPQLAATAPFSLRIPATRTHAFTFVSPSSSSSSSSSSISSRARRSSPTHLRARRARSPAPPSPRS